MYIIPPPSQTIEDSFKEFASEMFMSKGHTPVKPLHSSEHEYATSESGRGHYATSESGRGHFQTDSDSVPPLSSSTLFSHGSSPTGSYVYVYVQIYI